MIGQVFLCNVGSVCIIYKTDSPHLEDGLNFQRRPRDGHGEPLFGILIELTEDVTSRRV
jgi:hypothetical protein